MTITPVVIANSPGSANGSSLRQAIAQLNYNILNLSTADIAGLSATLSDLSNTIATKLDRADFGTAATKNIGETGGVASFDDVRIVDAASKQAVASTALQIVEATQEALATKANLSDLSSFLSRSVANLSGDPTSADVLPGTSIISRNSSTGRISIWVNDAGIMIDLLSLNAN